MVQKKILNNCSSKARRFRIKMISRKGYFLLKRASETALKYKIIIIYMGTDCIYFRFDFWVVASDAAHSARAFVSIRLADQNDNAPTMFITFAKPHQNVPNAGKKFYF